MSESLIISIVLLGGGIVLMIVGFLGVAIGGWLVWRGISKQGERFLPKSPKGDVFTIPEAEGVESFPGTEEPSMAEKKILERTDQFLKRFTEEVS